MNFFEVLQKDLAHYLGGSFGVRGEDAMRVTPGRLVKAILDIDFRVVFLMRVSMALWRAGWRRTSLVMFYRLKSRYHVDIHPSVTVGPGLRFVHAFCIVMGAGTVVGEDVVVFGQAVLGKSRPDLSGDRMPRIGDHVLLGAGCKVLGGVSIPSRRLVPANCVVTASALANDQSLLVSLYDDVGEGAR